MKREINLEGLPQELLPEIDQMFKQKKSINKDYHIRELSAHIPTLEAALDKMFEHMKDIKKMETMKAVDPDLIQYEKNLLEQYENFVTGYIQEMEKLAKGINVTKKDVLEGNIRLENINVALKLLDYGVNIFTSKEASETAENLMNGKYRPISETT